MRVLVVEDEVKVANALKEGLEDERYETVVAHTGEDAFFRITTEQFDVILLDLMLPGRDGLQILTSLRKQGIATPVLLLTARDSLEDRVAGLRSGADDYLVKPFAFEELLARIEALLRRTRPPPVETLSFADVELNARTHEVQRAGQPIELTARGFALLEYFLRHPRQVLTREQIFRAIWGSD